MPSLILLKSPGGASAGQIHSLDEGTVFVIGRDAEQCQIVVPNSAVSRKHAVLTLKGGKYIVEDMGSRNGTLINQNRIAVPTALKNEDRVKICDFLFRFYDENAPKLAPAVLPAELADAVEANESDEMTTVRHSFSASSSGAKELLEVQPSDRLLALLEISTNLSRTLEMELLLPQIADTLFSVFKQADRCFVIMLDEQGRMIPKVEKSHRSRPGGEGLRFSKTIIKKCLDSAQSYLSEDAASDSAMGAAQSIAEFRIRSVMCVPLMTAEGKPLGALQLDTQDIGKKFRDDDLKMLTIVGNLASVAIEKAQVLAALVTREKERKEIEVARKVQVGFLPKSFPELPGYEFFAYYSPAQSVGGDYYDFITLPRGRVAIVLGDVAGKGVAAALLMAKLSAEVRFSMLIEPDPAKAIMLLNNQLINGGIGDRFVTLAAMIIDPAVNQVTVVNAGHINPMKMQHGSPFADVISHAESGLPLGLVVDYVYEAKTIEMNLGETLIVFTDGVTDAEAPDDSRFQHDGIHLAVKQIPASTSSPRPRSIGDHVIRAVDRHANGRAQSDDIAFVSFGRVEENIATTSSGSVPKLVEPDTGRLSKN